MTKPQTNAEFLSARPQYSQSPGQLRAYVDEAVDWEATHGLLLRAPKLDGDDWLATALVPAPVALAPSPIPRSEFDKVVALQPVFNQLFDRVARDHDFLTSTLESLGSADEFTLRILAMYIQQRVLGVWKPAVVGIHRSDYLIHAPENEPDASPLAKQVEFNTIASSFASLSSIVGDFHRHMLAKTEYKDLLQAGNITKDQLPANESLTSIADGLAAGFKLYGNTRGDKEVAVAYYRSGYAPTDFPSEKEWDGRWLVESSRTIPVPSLAYHLAGCKKIQQVLAQSGVVERYVDDQQAAELVRECFVGLYPLDNTSEGQQAYDLAMANPSNYVVKPQREGGGYNTYGDDIPKLLSSLSDEERKGYILMDLIRAPGFRNVLLRNGQLVASEVVSELGIYGVWVSDTNGDVVINRSGGHLLRTKASDVYEGGVAAGFAVIDSPLLI
ncbi:Glutathione synthetase [Coemansia sp. RSA 455]|nr:Glutathione synthetase [Coemansia sp. RSA 455]